jgi:hypothetical protein
VSAELPETSATPLDNTMADAKDWESRSRIPDFAGYIRLGDDWGHVQLSGLLRDVGIENTAYDKTGTPANLVVASPTSPSGYAVVPNMTAIPADHQDVLGWGVHLTASVVPFQHCDAIKHDIIQGGVLYGDGVGNYVQDLRALGGYDAQYTTAGQLRAIPVFSYWASYTHFWSSHLSSTVVFSEVNADTASSPSFPTTGPQGLRIKTCQAHAEKSTETGKS